MSFYEKLYINSYGEVLLFQVQEQKLNLEASQSPLSGIQYDCSKVDSGQGPAVLFYFKPLSTIRLNIKRDLFFILNHSDSLSKWKVNPGHLWKLQVQLRVWMVCSLFCYNWSCDAKAVLYALNFRSWMNPGSYLALGLHSWVFVQECPASTLYSSSLCY